MEQTFIMIKPDGVQRGLVRLPKLFSLYLLFTFTYYVSDCVKLTGFLVHCDYLRFSSCLKLITVDRAFAEKHYADLSAKPFFNGLVEYIVSGPVVAMVLEGKGVVTTGRKIIGATNPLESAPGTIRGDYAVDIGRNIIHRSDAVESARKEIALWFPEGIAEWQSNLHSWIYE
ncbi:hypothetical protein RND71_001356 [Anisodus tanguticus]|uniref:nucleoside-diphosphate kinase n=1 Tax=Anisodus tanguticus TaxID=243964 RepID=A0AAE1VY32_9SOLA|nr:hypothetical protein RND71_001356 [Anisodus tanguticus]